MDYWAHLGLGNLGLREGGKQLLDDLKLSHLHGVPVLLHLDVNAGKTELLLLEGVEDVVGDDAPHPVQLPGQLQLLHEGTAHNGSGGSADASLQEISDPTNLSERCFFLNFTWQLKMTGQEAVVSFSMATIWSKFSSAGA